MPKPNPAEPRFEWILHRYPPAVVFRVLRIWMFAVGADDAARVLTGDYAVLPGRQGLPRRPLPFRDPLLSPHERDRMMQADLRRRIRELTLYGTIPRATPYDRYIPWLARFLDGLLSRVQVWLDRIGVSMPPGWILGIDPVLGDPPAPLAGAHARLDAETYSTIRESAQAFTESRAALANEFRALADYARATGLDVNRIKTPNELGDALADARDWGRARAVKVETVPGELRHTFPDGWTVQELTNQDQLAYETKMMRHCIADYATLGGDSRYYSLRDPDGRPRVTFEHWHGPLNDAYVEVKAFANQEPEVELVRRIACFRLAQPDAGGWEDVDSERFSWLPGFVQAWTWAPGHARDDRDESPMVWALVMTTARGGDWSWDLIPGPLLESLPREARERAEGEAEWSGASVQHHYEQELAQVLREHHPIVGEINVAGDSGAPRNSAAWLLWKLGYGRPADPGHALITTYAHDEFLAPGSRDELVQLLAKNGLFHRGELACR